ncbi:MAG: ATP-dependent DNA helicase RecG [Deltaproteobacteria bacterium]|nr:ATP-dependent DNA helicase RecG [Deltaproteobacteria bacterium]
MSSISSQLVPTTPIQYLKGVGPYLAGLLNKKSVYTAWDLLFFLPIKYIDRRELHTIKSLPVDKKQAFLATIKSYHLRPLKNRGRKLLEILVADPTGMAQISFFQFNESYIKKRFPVGSAVVFFGDVRLYRGYKTLAHPEMELWEEDDDPQKGEGTAPPDSCRIYPFYSLTEGLYQKTVRNIIAKNIDRLVEMVKEDPRSVRDTGAVHISLSEAFRYVHFPPKDADIDRLSTQSSPYHQRIIYDEFFYLQLGLLSKQHREAQNKTHIITNQQTLYQKALDLLGFELTGDQQLAIEEIIKDLASGKPMNRMLQGDVGSGKTVVAFLSALVAVESGFQAALMAPTEILAEQHFQTLSAYQEKLLIRIEILTGSTTAKAREVILQDLKEGKVDIIIGTHALIESDVEFCKLGFITIDEQHRFGVLQRAKLKNKTKGTTDQLTPHILTMTATPIPRTLSMCVYGDLDLSLIKEMPKGRRPVNTKVFREKQRALMYDMIRQEIEKGRQAYFVYPLVEESEKLDLKDATLMHKNLSEVFAGHEVGLLHGRMKGVEKERIMHGFKNREIQVLVATTVVEVGVDVPNSTVMVIEHAERFGLSQLHQLRGRVGRGSELSYCFLVAGYAQSLEAKFRLKIMEETTDGFKIAEEDLRLRGPGEFLGTRQSGMPDFRLAQIVRDGKLLNAAKNRALEVIKEDPSLSGTKNKLMREIMLERWGKRLDLSLV